MTDDPSQLPFVLEVPSDGVVHRETEHGDLYTPASAAGPLPAVVFVPGPAQTDQRSWPMYEGYGRLAAQRGFVGVVVNHGYSSLTEWQVVADRLPGLLDELRGLSDVDTDRLALWAFSGAGLLMNRWLEAPPSWLRVLGLTYPVFAPSPPAPRGPVVLTRAGQERADWLARVDEFAAHPSVQVIDVPDGRHAFDLLDHTDQSRTAVLAAIDAVTAHLS